jgi:AmmeMemoRadiSam system protein A
MAQLLLRQGYGTHAIHNNKAKFYSRDETYSSLGFQSFTSLEYMLHFERTKTGWAKDNCLPEEIMKAIDCDEEPDFVFTISVQGHGRYPKSELKCEEHVKVTLDSGDPELTNQFGYFVNQCYTKYSLVRIGLSGLPLSEHYRFGQMIQKAAEKLQRRAVLIGSGDLSHKLREEGPYGFVKEGPEYDERIMDVMGRAAFDELLDFDESFCDKAAECGHRSFCILAGALDGLKLETERLSHEDTFGVGYGICTYKVTGEDESRKLLKKWEERRKRILLEKREKEDAYVRLARATIQSWIRNKTREPLPKELPKEMLDQRAGVFVSLHKDDRLRGCIGTIEPVRSCVAEEIQENAISAATRDPRFSPVSVNELEKLEINVDVLTAPEEISSKSELDVKKYGVIVSKGSRRGLLLPDLDGVDNVEEQVSIALRKAGISEKESGIKLERFEVVRHV